MAWRFRILLLVAFCLNGPAVGSEEIWQETSTGMPFVAVAKGCFEMGSSKAIPPPLSSLWREISYAQSINKDELPRHQVCLDAFWIGKYEVTVDEWRAVMDSTPVPATDAPRTVAAGGITWEQANTFAARLSERSGGKHRFRLPTEAEWEYACRAGDKADQLPDAALAKTAQFGIDEIDRNNLPRRTGQLAANPFGIHDMLGNVWEWTADSYLADAYAKHRLHAPLVSAGTGVKVIRGGSVRSERVQLRCAMRGHQDAAEVLRLTGFRLVRER